MPNKKQNKHIQTPANVEAVDVDTVDAAVDEIDEVIVDVADDAAEVETDAKSEIKVEEVKEEVKEIPEAPAEKPKNIKDIKNTFSSANEEPERVAKSSGIAPGMSAKIKGTATNTFTGSIIPPVARNKKYTVSKVVDGRVILQAGTYSIALKEQDVLTV